MGYKNFREVYHRMSIVLDDGYCLEILGTIPNIGFPSQGVNSTLVYGYVDKVYGVSYKILGLTYYVDGDYTLVWSNNEVGLTVRGESLQAFDFVSIENKALNKQFDAVIENVKLYSTEEEETIRSFEFLDPFRHQKYPDDVMIIIENSRWKKREKIWARLKKYVGKSPMGASVFLATLLDEPFENIYGLHMSDEFWVAYFSCSSGNEYLFGMSEKKNMGTQCIVKIIVNFMISVP